MKYVIKHKSDIQDKFVLLSLCLHIYIYIYNGEKKIIDKKRKREREQGRERDKKDKRTCSSRNGLNTKSGKLFISFSNQRFMNFMNEVIKIKSHKRVSYIINMVIHHVKPFIYNNIKDAYN